MFIKKTLIFSILIIVFSVLLSSIMTTKDFHISSNIFYREMKLQGPGAVEVSEKIQQCKKDLIDDSLFCFQEYVSEIYFYLPRLDHDNPTIEQLMQEGGDCLNWAMFWDMAAKKMGYKVKPIIIKIDGRTQHRFSIIYNSQGYCSVDGRSVDCYLYE